MDIFKHHALIIWRILVHWMIQIFQILTYYTISKITSVTIITNLIRKTFKYVEAIKFMVVNTNLLNFYFLVESSNFIIGNKYLQLFSLKWQSHFIHLRKRSPKMQVWVIIVVHLSVVVSSKSVSWEKKPANSAPNSNNCLSAFPQNRTASRSGQLPPWNLYSFCLFTTCFFSPLMHRKTMLLISGNWIYC